MSAEPLVEFSGDVAKPPSIKVMVPAAMRRFTEQKAALDLCAATVGEALRAAAEKYPQLHSRLFALDGHPYRFINVFVNATDIRHEQQEETTLREGDVVVILPAIAGG